MDDPHSAELRRRAQAVGLGIEWSREDDHAVVHFLAWAAPAQADDNAPRPYPLARRVAAAAPAPAAAASPRASRATAAPPPSASQDTLSPNVDAAATANNLREAANDGVPFCEECARAAGR